MARCTNHMHAFAFAKTAVQIGEYKYLTATRPDLLHIRFDLIEQAVVRRNLYTGIFSSTKARGPCFSSPAVGFGMDVGDFFEF